MAYPGWWFQILWKIWKSIGINNFPIYGKIIQSCSKPPPTSCHGISHSPCFFQDILSFQISFWTIGPKFLLLTATNGHGSLRVQPQLSYSSLLVMCWVPMLVISQFFKASTYFIHVYWINHVTFPLLLFNPMFVGCIQTYLLRGSMPASHIPSFSFLGGPWTCRMLQDWSLYGVNILTHNTLIVTFIVRSNIW